LARAKIEDKDITDILADVQETLLNVGSDLATPLDKPVPVERIGKDKFNQLEKIMEKYEKEMKPINRFVIPGGSEQSALLHVARSVARRAERRLVTVKKERQINDNILIYINRLSDLLFVLARTMNKRKDVQDELWVR